MTEAHVTLDPLAEAVASIIRDIKVKREPYTSFAEPSRYAVWDTRVTPAQKVSLPGKHGATVERQIALQTALIIKLFKGTSL